MGCIIRDIMVIDSQVAIIINANAGLLLFGGFLRNKADLSRFVLIVLVVVAIDRLAIEQLTDRLDVFLQASVRTEESAALRLGRGVARQSTSSLGNVCQELGRLEGIALLLLELLILGGILGLLCLLRQSTSRNLSLRA